MFDTEKASIVFKIHNKLINFNGFTYKSIGENLKILLYQFDNELG